MARDEQREAWVARHVEVTGPIELAFERSWASVWRVPTAAGPAWLKECAPVQAFEPYLTAALARRWPDRLPEVIAHDARRRLLLLADAGTRLGTGGGVRPWLDVLPRYAELQSGEVPHAAEHLAAGVPDRRLEHFPELYEAMLERVPALLGEDELQHLRSFGPRFVDLCAELASAGIPETVQHDDLHGNNVFRLGDTSRILDWGDSCTSHPFLTFRVTFVHLSPSRRDGQRGLLRDAYLEPWGPPAELEAPFELAQRLAPFAHLFVLLRVLDAAPGGGLGGYTPDLSSTLRECVEST